MVIIQDIKLTWAHDSIYSDENLCQGQILVDEKGWFEGMVTEPNLDGGEHFVFGVLSKGVGVDVYELDESNIPFRFVAVKTPNEDVFTGAIFAITQMDNIDGIDLEKAKVDISSSSLTGLPLETIGEKVVRLHKKIDDYKQEELPKRSRNELYERVKDSACIKHYNLEVLSQKNSSLKSKTISLNPKKDN